MNGIYKLDNSNALVFPNFHACIVVMREVFVCLNYTLRAPCSSDHKESSCSAEDLDLTPGSERSLGEGNG